MSPILPIATPPTATPSDSVGAGLVETGITLDVMGRGGKMTSVRRTFCLFVLSDLITIFILWVIYTQLIGDTVYEAFDKQVLDYTFKTSLFDTVLMAALCLSFTGSMSKTLHSIILKRPVNEIM